MGDRSDLWVPLRRVVVELSLNGRAARRMELFLGQYGGHDRQEIIDLVEGERQFLPCRDLELGATTLVNRDHVTWLAVPLGGGAAAGGDEGELGPLFDHRHHVTLRLSGGGSIEGALLYSAPTEHARLTDHVNEPGAFLVLHGGERLVLVRKSAVVDIVEAGAAGAAGAEEQPR